MKFSTADRQLIQTLAQQSHVSEGAVEALFTAVQASNGTAAQFNHPDLGGMGQWMAGGMTMIGDFSNQRLRARSTNFARPLLNICAHSRKRANGASAAVRPSNPRRNGGRPN